MTDKTAGQHDFTELEKPFISGVIMTLSTGVFEWVPAKQGGLKRSKAKVRVRGNAYNADAINTKAREIADQLDAGTYSGPKTVTV